MYRQQHFTLLIEKRLSQEWSYYEILDLDYKAWLDFYNLNAVRYDVGLCGATPSLSDIAAPAIRWGWGKESFLSGGLPIRQ